LITEGKRIDWMPARGYKPVRVVLNRVVDEIPGVKSFYFDYRRDEFRYKASQSIHLHLDFDRDQGMYRPFSLGSSPSENFLLLTTKIKEGSDFKQRLSSLRDGDPAVVLGPVGNFSLPEDGSKRVVMVANGIGITPFRSMIKYATDKQLPHKITLLYINRAPEAAIFRDELGVFESKNPNVEIVWKFTDKEALTARELLDRFLHERASEVWDSRYYLAGPPSDVSTSLGVLREKEITDIRMEVFTGYE